MGCLLTPRHSSIPMIKPKITVYKTDQCRACPVFIGQLAAALTEADLIGEVDFVQCVPPYDDTFGHAIPIVPMTIVSFQGKVVMSYLGVTSPLNIIDDIEQILAQRPY